MSIDSRKYLKLLADYDKHCALIAQATDFDINESPEAKLKFQREIELTYKAWFEHMFPNFAKKPCAWFHIWFANLIINNKRIRAMAEWFRSAAKSVHIDMGIPLYLDLVKNDLGFMLLIGETQKKANALISGIQAQLEYNKRLKYYYGEKFLHGDWAEGDFSTTDGTKYMAIGFSQNPRGAKTAQGDRPRYIVIDDVDSKNHVNNDRMMREAIDYITEDVWGCFDSDDDGTERFVYANNNFNKNSITNRLKQYFITVLETQKLNKKSDREEGLKNVKYVISTVCAVKNLSTFEPEWPEKTSAEYWKEKYNNMPKRSFLREYMHKHVQDGKVFKYEDIQHAPALKLSEYDALCFYGDLSYKTQGDYKGLILIGKKERAFHVIYTYLRQKSRADVATWLYDLYEAKKLQNFNIRYMIEGLFAQDEFVNDFDFEGDKRGYYIPVVADKRIKADKFDRIESLSGHFERRNVYFNSDAFGGDQEDLIDQFLAFEKGSNANDDGPDAAHGAMAWLNNRTHQSKNTYVFQPRADRKF